MNLEKTTPKPFVFVLMPFSKEFVDTYELGIKQTCIEAGAYCERVDEQHFDGSIIERIYNQISKADVVIADMTGKNPNVFYETGYAHALGKKTILLTKDNDDIPFDLKHFTHIIYGGSIINLKKDLQPKIEWAISNPAKNFSESTSALSFRLMGKEILENTAFEIPFKTVTEQALANSISISITTILKIDIQNLLNKPFDARSIQIGVEIPNQLSSAIKDVNVVELKEGRSLALLKNLGTFLPSSWESLPIKFLNSQITHNLNKPQPFALHIFSEMGTRVIQFSVKFTFLKETI